MIPTSGAFIVSWDFSHSRDVDVLIVGRQIKAGNIEIINAFQGEDARAVYDILTDKKKGE